VASFYKKQKKESAEIADVMKKIYELAWIGAKHESAKVDEPDRINL